MRKITLLSCILMATQLVYSQEAIPVSGGDAIGPEGSGTYSVGQTFYTTYTAATGSVSQGVQQPFEFSANTNAPVIAVPENITVNTDANQCGAIVPFAATDATGIPNSVITYDIQPDSFFAVGTTTVTATATNLVGTSILAFDVTVVDNEVPTITLNGNATITHNAFTTYADLGASATDNCGTPNVSVGGDVVDVNTVGTYVITYDAVDTSRENATQVIRTLNVIDTTKPTAIAQNVAVQLNANGNATITAAQVNNGSSDDSDASGDNLSYTLSQTSFDCSSAGNNPVTLTVTDASGNTSMATAIVTVNDIIAPSIATLTNIIVNNDAGRCGANLVILRPVTADNCLSGGTVLNFDGQNDYISINHQTEMASVNYTAEAWIYVTGGAVHKAIFSKRTPSDGFNLYVTGNTLQLWNGWSLPINGPQIQNNEWIHVAVTGNSSGQKMFVGGLLVGSTSAVVIPSSASTQFTIGVNNDGNSPWFFGGNMKNVRFWNKELTQAQIQSNMTNSVNPQSGLVLNFPMSGGNAEGNNIGIGSLADQSGNGFNGTFNNFTLNSTSSNFVADPLSGSSVIITNDYNHTANASGVYPVGTTTIQWTATDLAGNFTTSEQIVTVEDNEAPTIVSKLATVTLTASGTVIITPEDVLERGIDNCSGTITYTLSQSAFGVTDANNSPITVQLTGTDTSGNATIVPAQVTVIDPLPIVITQNITVELDENGEATINATQIDNGSNSVVGLAEEDGLSLDISTFNCSNIGNPVTVTLTVTGNNDNVSSATAIVTVEDTIVPVAITQNITIQLDVSGNASITPQDIDSSGSNDADLVGYWKFDEGSGNVVTDASGNDLNGSFADGLTWGANSPANGGSSALNFNGAYAEVADNPILNDLQDEMSIEAWIFQTDGANNAIIDRGNYNFLFMTMPNGQPGLGFYNGNDGWSYSSTPIEVNQWVHVAMTWDKSTKTLKFYKNGVEIDSFVRSSNLNFHNGGPINIGRQSPYTCSCNPMNGAMDELRLWNSVRTQDEIQNNMNSSINEQGGSSDACGIASLSLNKDTFTCANVGENIVILTVTDNNNNVSTQTAIVTVEDKVIPVITASADIHVFATSAAGAVVNYSTPVGTDNCSVTTAITIGLADGATFPIGTTVVTYVATDGSGNTASASFNVEVVGVAPVIVVPADITVNNDSGQCGALVLFAATDATGIPISDITYDTPPDTFFAVGTTTVTATATNAVGTAILTFDVTVEDTTAPVFVETLPGNITVECDSVPDAVVLTVTDNCDAPAVVYAEERTDGSSANNYTLTRTWTATDVAGNIVSHSQVITVEDTTAPVFVETLPLDVTVECSSVPEAVVLTVTDNCDAPGVVYAEESTQNADQNNAAHYNYTITRTWRSTDATGNFTESTQVIRVQDVTAPTITDVADIRVNCQDVTTSSATGTATGTDICSAIVITQSDVSTQNTDASTYDYYNYTITRTWRSTDVTGNFTESTQVIRVQDVTAPTITDVADITVNCQDVTTSSATGTATGTDICSAIVITQSDVSTQNTDASTYDYYNYTITRTWRSTDVTGNFTESTQVIRVQDVTAPTITDVADITVNCQDVTTSSATGTATGTDICSAIVITQSDVSTQNADASTYDYYNYTITRTWRSTDVTGNFTESSQVIRVHDITAPIAIAQDITVTLDEYGDATITADDIDNGSSDNCTYTPYIDVTTFDCTNIGLENTVTLTVTDASGNTDFTTATVTILEHFKETLDLRSLTSFGVFTGGGAITNSGTFTGDVGTDTGILTGFSGSSFNGNIHNSNGLTAQARIDLLKVYIHLNNVSVTHPGTHAPAFGNGETLTSGVYSTPGAGSVAGTLYLDGRGDPNPVFIIKFRGAFTAGAGSNIVLLNGAKAANVYWIAQGALSVGANSVIEGTLLAYPGAITLGVNSSIKGRLISSSGAITVATGAAATMPVAGAMNIPINPMVSYTPAAAVDVLGSLESFSLFSSIGAVANASFSGILGDVGADVGAITGFATSVQVGSFYNGDAVTAQAKIDLDNAYNQLMLIPTTVSNHTPAFGSGETLTPGVYLTPGAGSLAGTITLDGQNNPDAVFILKFKGAFAAAAQSKVILSNGTRRCNVFWISEGATSIGAFSYMRGTVLAHGGAATMGAGGNLEGRLLSTDGAIGFSTSVVYTVVHDVECVENVPSSTSAGAKTEVAIKLHATKLMAYPNPFSTNATVSFTIPYEEANATLALYDLKGALIKVLYNGKSNANQKNEVQFNRENLETGVYLFRLTTSKEAKNLKVIMK